MLPSPLPSRSELSTNHNLVIRLLPQRYKYPRFSCTLFFSSRHQTSALRSPSNLDHTTICISSLGFLKLDHFHLRKQSDNSGKSFPQTQHLLPAIPCLASLELSSLPSPARRNLFPPTVSSLPRASLNPGPDTSLSCLPPPSQHFRFARQGISHSILTHLDRQLQEPIVMSAATAQEAPAATDPVVQIFTQREQVMIVHALISMKSPAVSSRWDLCF